MGKKFQIKTKYTTKDFKKAISCFTSKTTLHLDTKNIVDQGGHSIIYPAISKGGRIFIAKIMYIDEPNTNELQLILNDGKFSLKANHPSVIKSFAFYELVKGKCYSIVMQKASFNLSQAFNHLHSKGILKSDFSNNKNKPSNYLYKYFLNRILKSLMYFNSNNWVHLDIKPQNFLLFGNEIKLADFSLSKVVDKSQPFFNLPFMGTPSYMAPEYYVNNGIIKSEFAEKVDIFALGCLFYKMIFNENVIQCNKNNELYSYNDVISDINNTKDKIIKSCLNEEVKDLLLKMLH